MGAPRAEQPSRLPTHSNILKGTYIFVQEHGRSKSDTFSNVSFIRRHGGSSVADPWAPFITHAIVSLPENVGRGRDYCHLLDRTTLGGPHPESESQFQRLNWPFERILEVFTQCNKTYPSGAKVMQEQWLEACVEAGRRLDGSDKWGGWLVRSEVSAPTLHNVDASRDPRLRKQLQNPQGPKEVATPPVPDLPTPSPSPLHSTAYRPIDTATQDPPSLMRRESNDRGWSDYHRARDYDRDRYNGSRDDDRWRPSEHGSAPDARDNRPSRQAYVPRQVHNSNNFLPRRPSETERDSRRGSASSSHSRETHRHTVAQSGQKEANTPSAFSKRPLPPAPSPPAAEAQGSSRAPASSTERAPSPEPSSASGFTASGFKTLTLRQRLNAKMFEGSSPPSTDSTTKEDTAEASNESPKSPTSIVPHSARPYGPDPAKAPAAPPSSHQPAEAGPSTKTPARQKTPLFSPVKTETLSPPKTASHPAPLPIIPKAKTVTQAAASAMAADLDWAAIASGATELLATPETKTNDNDSHRPKTREDKQVDKSSGAAARKHNASAPAPTGGGQIPPGQQPSGSTVNDARTHVNASRHSQGQKNQPPSTARLPLDPATRVDTYRPKTSAQPQDDMSSDVEVPLSATGKQRKKKKEKEERKEQTRKEEKEKLEKEKKSAEKDQERSEERRKEKDRLNRLKLVVEQPTDVKEEPQSPIDLCSPLPEIAQDSHHDAHSDANDPPTDAPAAHMEASLSLQLPQRQRYAQHDLEAAPSSIASPGPVASGSQNQRTEAASPVATSHLQLINVSNDSRVDQPTSHGNDTSAHQPVHHRQGSVASSTSLPYTQRLEISSTNDAGSRAIPLQLMTPQSPVSFRGGPPLVGFPFGATPPPGILPSASSIASQAMTPGESGSQGIFAAGRRYPMTFHVVDFHKNHLIKNLIVGEGGGVIVPLAEADYIILPLNKGQAATDAEHCAIIQGVNTSCVARVLSRDWIFECVGKEDDILDLEPFLIHATMPPPEHNTSRAASSALSAPPSSLSPAGMPAPLPQPVSQSSTQLAPSTKRRHSGVTIAPSAAAGPGPNTQTQKKQRTARGGKAGVKHKSTLADLFGDEEDDEEDEQEDHADSDNEHNNPTSGPSKPRASQAENIEFIIAELRGWDRQGGLYDFLRMIKPDARHSMVTTYKDNKEYILSCLPWLAGYIRRGRASNGD